MEQVKKLGLDKVTETAKEARKFQKRILAAAHEAHEKGQKVAWGYFGSFCEPIFKAFDIVSVYPENYGALCALKRVQESFLDRAIAAGYSNVSVCGYLKVALGFANLWRDKGVVPVDAPDQGLSKPDLILSNSTTCDSRIKVCQNLGRYWDVPHYCLDISYPTKEADLRSVKGYYIRYLMEELKGLIAFLEKQTGKRCDPDRLMELVQLQHQVLKVYNDVYELRKAVPCPLSGAEMFSCIAPAFFFSADPESLDFYIRLREEVKNRVESRIGAIPQEKYRLIWGFGIPVWHTMTLLQYLESLGAVLVMEFTYWLGEPYEVDSNDPLRVIAEKTWERYTNPNPIYVHAAAYHHLGRVFAHWAREFRADGILQHTPLSCHAVSVGGICYNNMAVKLTGLDLPVLYLQSDMVDPRMYSEAETKAKVSAFIETLEARK